MITVQLAECRDDDKEHARFYRARNELREMGYTCFVVIHTVNKYGYLFVDINRKTVHVSMIEKIRSKIKWLFNEYDHQS